MKDMPQMLAYTIRGGGTGSNYSPLVVVGQGPSQASFYPENAEDGTYWYLFLDAYDPTKYIKDFQAPGIFNTIVPEGLDTYMTNPNYLYVITTQSMSIQMLPQGDLYNYLVKYGAGRELNRLEQINTTLGSGTYGFFGYSLIGSCGPRGGPLPPPPSYELSTVTNNYTLMTMSLMPMPGGGPPYSLCDCETFLTS